MEKIIAFGKFVDKLTGKTNYNDVDYAIGIDESGKLFAFWSMSNHGDDMNVTTKQAIADLNHFIEQDREMIKSARENTRTAKRILEILHNKKI